MSQAFEIRKLGERTVNAKVKFSLCTKDSVFGISKDCGLLYENLKSSRSFIRQACHLSPKTQKNLLFFGGRPPNIYFLFPGPPTQTQEVSDVRKGFGYSELFWRF